MTYTAEEFRQYIRESGRGYYDVSEDERGNLTLITDYADGQVVFHEQDIIELIITTLKDGENAFYLHFRLEDREHALNLFTEMRQTLIELKIKRKHRVLLSCSSGLTTSYFASELSKAADTLRLDYEFSAVSYDHIFEKGFDYDIILLAPQIHFQYEKTKQIFRDAIVMKIPAAIFAQYNTGQLIELVNNSVKQADEADENVKRADPRKPFENPYRILTVGMINHQDRVRIGYRIYDHGKRTLDREVLKQSFSLQDLDDLLDYVFARHHNIDAVALAIPGVTYRGRVFHSDYGLWNEGISFRLRDKYHVEVILINDVNAMALGYYALHENSDDMVFYFQPDGMVGAGAGVIIDGKLRTGKMHAAGEVYNTVSMMVPDARSRINSPEGVMELVTAGMLVYISAIAPQKIVLYSKLTPDTEEIRRSLQKHVADQYIPDIEYTPGLKRYILPGAMVHCLEVLEGYRQSGDWSGYEHKKQ
ncbi:MAG: ROK family protein [Erysipelotrichaceae bacterium]|nr:ROK family protein [Erysipelotrichaceae bacterium]